MKSKITKIQIFKEGIAVLLVLMFVATPIVYATTSLDDGTIPTNSIATNNVVNTNNTVVTGNNTTGNTTTEGSGIEGGNSESGLSWKEIFFGKVVVEADKIQEKIEKGETTIEIKDEVQLRAIAELVNNRKEIKVEGKEESIIGLKGIKIFLKDNIVINSDEEWIPIGTEEVPFEGMFLGGEINETGDGVKDPTKGKKISNLEYLKSGKTYKELINVGLFGVLGSNAEVHNIIIDNFNIDIIYASTDVIANTGSTEGVRNIYYYNAGNIAGINKGIIKNCFSLSDIKGGSYIGSIAGINEGTIEECTNTGVVMGYDFVGGIAGNNIGTIKNCKNIGDVKGAESAIGGIAGAFNASNDNNTIIFSHNTGNIEGNSHVGGIVGGIYSGNGKIQYCMHEGKTTYDTKETNSEKIFGILGNMKIAWLDGGKYIFKLNDSLTDNVENCITKAGVGGGSNNQVAYLSEIGDNCKHWGYVVQDPMPHYVYENGYEIFWGAVSVGQSKYIKEIVYENNSVFITDGYYEWDKKNEETSGNIVFNTNNTIITGGSSLDVEYEEDNPDVPIEPDEPTKPVEDPLGEGETRKDITEFFPTFIPGEEGESTGAVSKTTVTYSISKKDKVITENGYFKVGDIIEVTAKFNKRLEDTNGNLAPETAPKLKLKVKTSANKDEYREMTAKTVANTTISTVYYEYTVKEGDNFEVKEIVISGCENLYAAGEKENFKAKGKAGEASVETPVYIVADTIAPTYNTIVYVQNNLETARYRAGKEILFKVKISEAVQSLNSTKPAIQVSFSESGIGKYNYNTVTGESGFAKFRSDLTETESKKDGTTTWVYSYQIQEGDEGYLDYECFGGEILDLAGNAATMKESVADNDVTGKNWDTEDLNIEPIIYKNDKEITDKTTFTKDDKLKISIEFDKVLYDAIGIVSNKDQNGELRKEAAPSLYLNGKASLVQASIDSVEHTEDGNTIVTYIYDVAKIIQEKDRTLVIHKLVLKNENNKSVSVTVDESANGVTPYSEEYYDEYKKEDAKKYKFIAEDAVKELDLDFNLTINAGGNSSDGNNSETSTAGIYADTTAPSVEITTNTTEPTNADEITYTFKFSEEVRGFEESDITVNGGTKVAGSFKTIREGYVYEIKVETSTLPEKEGFVQVIVEEGACVDLVAKEIVRQEKITTIDKVKPTLESYAMRKEGEKVIIEATFSEVISSHNLSTTLTIGGNEPKGTLKSSVSEKKVIYEYDIDAADGGEVIFSLNGTVKDVAGNESEEIDITIDRNKENQKIELERTSIVDKDNEHIWYSFEKNGVAIRNFAIPTYFKEGDRITVIRHVEPVNGLKASITEYNYTLVDDIKDSFGNIIKANVISSLQTDGEPVQMNGMTFSGNSAKFETDAADKLTNIEDANIYFDVLSPTARLSVHVEEPNANNIYASGKEFIITATTNEAIENNNIVPEIKVSFTNSGAGKYNKGIAKHIDTIENEDGTTTWKYKYILQDNDDGKSVVEFVEGTTITDLAGNKGKLDSYVGDSEMEDNWDEDLNVTYILYKNGQPITDAEYFTDDDELAVEVKFDKVLYTSEGTLNNKEETTPLLDIDAPSLYLNGDDILKGKVLDIIHTAEKEEINGTTTIIYNFDFKEIMGKDNIAPIIKVEYFALRNDSNASVKNETELMDIPYHEKLMEGKYIQEEWETYRSIEVNETKILKLSNPIIIDSYNTGYVYIDTAAPTVQITTEKDPTNADEIIFTFTFSEYVNGFTADDITVNNGVKAIKEVTVDGEIVKQVEFEEVEEGRVYTLKVNSIVPDQKEGILQVIVEKGACEDVVALKNIRQEKNITIDKVKPTLESYTMREEEDKIIVDFIFDEEIDDGEVKASLSIGDKAKELVRDRDVEIGEAFNYTLEIDDKDENKVIYTYMKDPSDGGKVEFSFEIEVIDKAGNHSEKTSVVPEEEIVLEQTVVKPDPEKNVYYTFEKNGNGINDFSEPTYFVKEDKITVTKHEEIEGQERKTTKYEYTVKEDIAEIFQSLNDGKPVRMLYMLLTEPKQGQTVGTAEFVASLKNDIVNVSDANIYFDVVAPKVDLSIQVEEQNENNVYPEGKELIITATTSEAIQNADKVVPEIKVSFTNSGLGKYNYQADATKGNALHVDTITNNNGSTTWKYKYLVQSGDDGKVIIEYAKDGMIVDLAGNATKLKKYPRVNTGDTNLVDNQIANSETTISYDIYKNGELLTDFSKNTYFADGDIIKVVAKFSKLLYSSWGAYDLQVAEDTAPALVIDDKKFEVLSVNNTDTSTEISYIYEVNGDADELLDKLTITTVEKAPKLFPTVTDEEGNISREEISGTISDKDITNCNLRIFNSATLVSGEEMVIDTIKPTVSITADAKNPTNTDKITYTFEFSEEVKDFGEEDITVNGGAKSTFIEETEGKIYKLEVIPDIVEGNEGNVQVIVEKDICTDKVGLGNVRAENVIKVDRKAPTLLGLEAYAPTDSNISLNEKIDVVKEYYKAGGTVTIVATFDENVTTEAKLVLQFSESGAAKGNVVQTQTIGNKISYTYVISEGDEGTLSVKAFTGNAIDAAGNEMAVTKRVLNGDTIIADTIAPKLKELKVVSPDEGVYKEGNTITIEAIYDEEIYILEDNEIKLVDTMIEVEAADGTKSYTNNAPTLKIKFGDGELKEAIVSGYGKKEDGSDDRTKLVYSYTIVGDRVISQETDGEKTDILVPGDNGELSIVSYENKDNVEVCDIAGNVADLTLNQTGSKIIADTVRPQVIDVTAVVENPTVLNTGIYHKAGNKVKITVEFDEKVSSAVIMPSILVGFSEDPNVEPKAYNTYSYESDWNVNSNTVEFTYTIKGRSEEEGNKYDGDNGYLWVKVPENQFKDEAGNANIEKAATKVENIFADTTDPYLATNTNSTSQWTIEYIKNSDGIATGIKAVGIFNEKVFSMKDNSIIGLNDIPLMGVFINGALQKVATNPSIQVANEKTKLTYQISIIDIDTRGKLSVNFIDGSVYDRAGNEMTIELVDGDITSPIFKDIKFVTPNGFYKAGKAIEIIARFEEETKLVTVPTLKAKVGEKEITLPGRYNSEDPENTDTIKVARYTYEIVDGDNGALNIISLVGFASDGVRTSEKISQIYIDLTDDDIDDVNGKEEELLNSKETTYANNGEEYVNVIADTIKPYITSVKAKANGKEIASYTKEEGKDGVVDLGRTNANEVEYVITFSELVNYKDGLQDTILYNGIIKSITNNDSDKDGYCTEITIKVQPTVEGVQSLMIPDNVFEDRAGNTNIMERFNIVTTDFTKPIIRFISEYNGGTYVLPKNIGNIEIRPNVEIAEDIAKIEYRWNDEAYEEIENYSSSSDIAVPERVFTEAGTNTLSIKVIDLAGNVAETSKTYEIINSYIEIDLSTLEYTNEDIIATVEFGKGLTDNRKVTFKAEGSEQLVELNPKSTNSQGGVEYVISENGTIYVEATDRVKNKVFTETTVTNIDKEAPEVEIALGQANLVIGTEKDTATIKTDVELSDNVGVEDAKFAYLQQDINIANMSDIDKAKISSELENEAKIEDAISTKDKTPYYLYVIAKDKAGNETIEKAGPFTVLDTNERTITQEQPETEEGEETTTPSVTTIAPEISANELIKFVDEKEEIKDQAYVSIEYKEDIIRDRKATLEDETYGNINESNNYVELYGNTKIKVEAWDACGNRVYNEHIVDDIVGPEFTINGNPDHWTNEDVELSVYCDVKLKELTVNGKDILSKLNVKITEYGNYTFKATDIYNNTSEQTVEVKIDKSAPEITEVKIENGKIVIVANDMDKDLDRELSGLKEYAITDTTEVPVEWSSSNEISVTKDRTFFAWAKDNAGNITYEEKVMSRDITPPELTLSATPSLDKWTNSDIRIDISVNEELESLVVRYKDNVAAEDGTLSKVDKEENLLESKTYVINQNNDYEFIAVDKSGNETKKEVKVAKIDKTAPVISKVETSGKTITVTAEDNLSGVVGYAITDTTEEPVEWDKSNKIEVTSDGTFYVWIKDNAGHVVRAQEVVVVDTTAPTIMFDYTLLTVEAGFPIEAGIITDEEAIISYSWDEKTWVDSEELLTSVQVSKECKTTGKYILYAKAIDKAGNESKSQIEFNVTKPEEVDNPEIIFEDLPTIQVDGIHYVKVAADMTVEDVTNKMNKDLLCGLKPEYINLIDNELKTGSKITLAGDTKYIVVVNGDVNCDGKVGPIDVTYANSIRLNKVSANTIQKLAADFDLDGIVKPIDITMINSYRLGKIKGI